MRCRLVVLLEQHAAAAGRRGVVLPPQPHAAHLDLLVPALLRLPAAPPHMYYTYKGSSSTWLRGTLRLAAPNIKDAE